MSSGGEPAAQATFETKASRKDIVGAFKVRICGISRNTRLIELHSTTTCTHSYQKGITNTVLESRSRSQQAGESGGLPCPGALVWRAQNCTRGGCGSGGGQRDERLHMEVELAYLRCVDNKDVLPCASNK